MEFPTLDRLEETLTAEQNQIPQEEFVALIRSMPNRMVIVLELVMGIDAIEYFYLF